MKVILEFLGNLSLSFRRPRKIDMPFITEKDVISIKGIQSNKAIKTRLSTSNMLQRKLTGRDVILHTESMQSQLKQMYKAVHIILHIEILATKKTNKQKLHRKRCYPAHRKYAELNQNKCTKLFILSCTQKIHKIEQIYIIIHYPMQRELFSSTTTVIELVWKLSL